MDEFIKKRIGILILALLTAFAFPLSEWLATLPISGYWIVFFLAAYGAIALFCEEVVRFYFKVPKVIEDKTESTEI